MYARPSFNLVLKQALYLVGIAIIVSLLYNALSPSGIPLVGAWSPKVLPSGVKAPPSYVEGDDAPVVSLAEAMALYNSGGAQFIDARKKEDYAAGHIKKALQLYMEAFDVEYPAMKGKLSKEQLYVIYCGGEDCELSLFLARNLKSEGFTNLKVFFGGWEEWTKAGLPTSTGPNP